MGDGVEVETRRADKRDGAAVGGGGCEADSAGFIVGEDLVRGIGFGGSDFRLARLNFEKNGNVLLFVVDCDDVHYIVIFLTSSGH